MPDRRRLVLHVGMGKTGSSALQVSFVRQRGRLAEHGVHYPAHASDLAAGRREIVSGNGMGILECFAPVRHQDAATERALAAVLAAFDETEAPTVLYSSEFLYDFTAERVRGLRDALAEREITLQVAVFVRDVAGHALSSYSQVVKRSLFTGTLGDYVVSASGVVYRLDLRERLGTLLEALGPDNVAVLHYNSVRHELFAAFLAQALGVSGLDDDDAVGEVNRSLTQREIDLMRHLNHRLEGKPQARAVSNALISLPPWGEPARSISRQDLATLEERHGADVAWVNETFFPDFPDFPDAAPLRLAGDDVRVVDDDPGSDDFTEQERRLLDWLAALAAAPTGENPATLSRSLDATRRDLLQVRDRRKAEISRRVRAERARDQAAKRADALAAQVEQARALRATPEFRVGRALLKPVRRALGRGRAL